MASSSSDSLASKAGTPPFNPYKVNLRDPTQVEQNVRWSLSPQDIPNFEARVHYCVADSLGGIGGLESEVQTRFDRYLNEQVKIDPFEAAEKIIEHNPYSGRDVIFRVPTPYIGRIPDLVRAGLNRVNPNNHKEETEAMLRASAILENAYLLTVKEMLGYQVRKPTEDPGKYFSEVMPDVVEAQRQLLILAMQLHASGWRSRNYHCEVHIQRWVKAMETLRHMDVWTNDLIRGTGYGPRMRISILSLVQHTKE